METYELSLANYLRHSQHNRLDNYKLLIQSAQLFLASKSINQEFAKILGAEIWNHRSSMSASKAYENATELDKELVTLSLQIARIGYSVNSKHLLPYLKAKLYYTQSNSEKENLMQEIKLIEKQ